VTPPGSFDGDDVSTSSVGAAPPGWGAGDDWSFLSAASFSRPASSDASFPELPGLECYVLGKYVACPREHDAPGD